MHEGIIELEVDEPSEGYTTMCECTADFQIVHSKPVDEISGTEAEDWCQGIEEGYTDVSGEIMKTAECLFGQGQSIGYDIEGKPITIDEFFCDCDITYNKMESTTSDSCSDLNTPVEDPPGSHPGGSWICEEYL